MTAKVEFHFEYLQCKVFNDKHHEVIDHISDALFTEIINFNQHSHFNWRVAKY